VLPWATTFLMSLSAAMRENWVLLLVGVVALGVGVFALLKTEIGAAWFDRLKLAVPIFRRMFRALYISRSLQTMGELINAGVPMLDTIADLRQPPLQAPLARRLRQRQGGQEDHLHALPVRLPAPRRRADDRRRRGVR
jgi:type II secretory pathway component PulF